jgi:hypothetical protein
MAGFRSSEKGVVVGENLEKRTSGAEARIDLIGLIAAVKTAAYL